MELHDWIWGFVFVVIIGLFVIALFKIHVPEQDLANEICQHEYGQDAIDYENHLLSPYRKTGLYYVECGEGNIFKAIITESYQCQETDKWGSCIDYDNKYEYRELFGGQAEGIPLRSLK